MTRQDNQADRIIRIATTLFAEHGFHGVSSREIAAACELNVGTVNYHVGGKRDLYHAVFRRMSEMERERVAATLRDLTITSLDSDEALHRVLERVADLLVTMTHEHPEVPRLWVRRWLDDSDADGADTDDQPAEIEAEYGVPVYRMFADLLDRIAAETGRRYTGPSQEMFLKSVTWILYGYALGGPLDWKLARGRPEDPANRAELTRFLTDYFRRMLGLAEPEA